MPDAFTPLAYAIFIYAIHRNQHLYSPSYTLLTDDKYSQLQVALSVNPDTGAIIPHNGRLRKIRWPMNKKGKRGGARVIYHWSVAEDQILMLFMYPKSEKDDLTTQQVKVLREIVEKEFK